MEVKTTCPLGSECEIRTKDTHTRCAWYVKIQGKNPQSDETIDEWRCAIAWMPIIQLEHSMHERQTAASVQSMRNETIQVFKPFTDMLTNHNRIKPVRSTTEKIENS